MYLQSEDITWVKCLSTVLQGQGATSQAVIET